jgi:hypothetical protein
VGFEDARYEVAELALPDGLVMLGVDAVQPWHESPDGPCEDGDTEELLEFHDWWDQGPVPPPLGGQDPLISFLVGAVFVVFATCVGVAWRVWFV